MQSSEPQVPSPSSQSPGAGPSWPLLPWEERSTRGYAAALFETVGLFVVRPREAFSRTRRRGDFASPIYFAMISAAIAALLQGLWSAAFPGLLFPFGAPEPSLPLWGSGIFVVVVILVSLLAAPLSVLIGAALAHGALYLLGGTSRSQAGFEGTVRVMGYSSIVQIFGPTVPLVGPLAALVWGVVLQVLGLSIVHETRPGTALAAILLPAVVCCLCVGGIVILAMGGLAAGLLSLGAS